VCYGNGGHGIDISNAPGQQVISNSVYENATAGINVEGSSGGTALANNVSIDTRSKGNLRVDSTAITGTTLDYDLVFLHAPGTMIVWGSTWYSSLTAFVTATGQEAHGLQADPHWEAPDNGDLHLLEGSLAID